MKSIESSCVGAQIVSSAIAIKGTRHGLMMAFGPGEMDDLLAELKELVASRETFFRGGEVLLHLGDRELTSRDVRRALEILEQCGVSVRAILGRGSDWSSFGLKIGSEESASPEPAPELPLEPLSSGVEAGECILVERTLRSGQSIHHAGHVVILGDVNSGAEVVAGGDIVVWGRLRGTVHAGATGDDHRSICALALSPTQLRIGNHIARPPEHKRQRKEFGPERAFVSNDKIVAEECK